MPPVLSFRNASEAEIVISGLSSLKAPLLEDLQHTGILYAWADFPHSFSGDAHLD